MSYLLRHSKWAMLSGIFILIVLSQPAPIVLIYDYAVFILLGIVGAVFANATGAGGGVVFVPIFNQLSLEPSIIIATSFAIQCCGMTAGAITWWQYYKTQQQNNPHWQSIVTTLQSSVPFSIGGVLIAQYMLNDYIDVFAEKLHVGFGVFSMLLALFIYTSIPFLKKQRFKSSLLKIDLVIISAIALLGGLITAWLSVGVGELVAVYLILRGFNVTFAIATAVVLSAFTVWSAIFHHIFISQAIYYNILIFAGVGAIVGGVLAKKLVLHFSVIKLKLFFATWILVMGVASLPLG